MARPEDAASQVRNGVLISIEVSPGSDREVFPDGYNPWRNTLGCRTMAPPRDGKANKAIISIIAKKLGVPELQLQIIAGSHASVKKILVEGLPRDVVLDKLFR